ncbi:SDR family NAD(P)-dependent oxidoreductase [Nocardioides marmoribigeumensis]|uniref:3-oxoacyl-[acyl-carrier protein] reductase n=1 Tax=Nocardioides marmoribigeumensis TaxID=433649 RepID=A0ABU2BVZ0_9ACTN|nr:SDR family oxidoreductase [Nocardioides marmoribigeumensis]MDR7362436.1 3-oxoacyl-[acyl-carrier protein] reductase [Nocardioides marmoribigeumensis]
MAEVPLPASADLRGQVAIVTGGAGALGTDIGHRLRDLGADVALLDVVEPSATLYDRGGGSGGGRLRGFTADLCDEHQVAEAIARILAWRGRVDVLVNNAGIFRGVPRVPFWEIDVATWDRVMETNARSVFLCSRAVAPLMCRARRGRIVNITSNTAAFGMANYLHYVASKAAIVGMTRTMARELGPYGVAVNAVAPGLVHTASALAELDRSVFEQAVAGQCLRTAIEGEDVAATVAFLSGAQARMITGQTLAVNAGATMGAF